MTIKKPRILFYDMETAPLQAWIWSPGKQYVGHKQLVKGHSRYGIICITYCWNDGKPAQSIDWGFHEQDTNNVVAEFDKILKTADHVIGKNNNRFDDKMLNAARMFAGLPGYPEWMKYTDDLEKQMRRYFRLPSQSLDYISNQLGLGGKISMQMQDWIDIVEKNRYGPKALKKMINYGKKDVVDTRTLWNRLCEHFEVKLNQAVFNDVLNACKRCASTDIAPNGSRVSGGVKYKLFTCKSCGHYAGRINAARVGGGKLT